MIYSRQKFKNIYANIAGFLEKRDQKTLLALLDLDWENETNLADILEQLYNDKLPDDAQKAFNNFRSRVNKQIQKANFKIEISQNKKAPRSQRLVWFVGPDVPKEVIDFSNEKAIDLIGDKYMEQPAKMDKPIVKYFLSYSHEDTKLVKRFHQKLQTRLKTSTKYIYRAWSDEDIIVGEDWEKRIFEAMNDVDIGLYPLLPNHSNRYKCGFKALEYMAMRIPVISSRVAENKLIVIEDKNGFFADECDEWIAAIRKLDGDAGLRRRMGRAGRALVEEKYSTKKSAALLANLVAEL